MIVAIASGKGGTGKTSVAAALSRVWSDAPIAVDLDVETPNLHLFLRPDLAESEAATLEIPVAVPDKCTGCGACGRICAYHAVAHFGNFPVVYDDLCRGCGGCIAVCPAGALIPGTRVLGEVIRGTTESGGRFVMGRSRIGEAQSPPLMRRVRAAFYDMVESDPADVIVDAPPGTSCPALEAVRDADLVVLVTEPTPFGLYDLRLAHKAFAGLGRKMAVVINRAGLGNDDVYGFCRCENLPILGEIPFDRAIAEGYARGQTLDRISPELEVAMKTLAGNIRAMATDAPRQWVTDDA